MRALVVYSSAGRMLPLAQSLGRGLEAVGYSVQLLEAGQYLENPISVAQYNLVCLGSPTVGTFGGQIASDVENLLKRVTRLEGKPCVAFVRSKLFGAARSVKALMAAMEAQGAMVQDFAVLSSRGEAERFGKRLAGLGRN